MRLPYIRTPSESCTLPDVCQHCALQTVSSYAMTIILSTWINLTNAQRSQLGRLNLKSPGTYQLRVMEVHSFACYPLPAFVFYHVGIAELIAVVMSWRLSGRTLWCSQNLVVYCYYSPFASNVDIGSVVLIVRP